MTAAHRPAIVGAGVMGTNIATLALGYGFSVTLVDARDDALGRARDQITRIDKIPKGV